MQSGHQNVKILNSYNASISKKKRVWTARLLSGLLALFLLADSVGKFVKPAPVVERTVELGYPESVILPLGIALLACSVLYVIPRTSVLGTILLTGYLGGAVATHVRVASPLFMPYTLFRFISLCRCGASFSCAMIACEP
jgi:hypothetical protein